METLYFISNGEEKKKKKKRGREIVVCQTLLSAKALFRLAL
jgi:hypothetical protein